MTDEQSAKQEDEFYGMRQLNFSVRLGKAIITVDFGNEKFLLRYRPNTPGGKCYEWQCNADGSIEEKNAEIVSTSTPMMPEEVATVEEKLASESGRSQSISYPPPIYVARAPESITPAMKEHLRILLKALGGGFIIPDTVTIEEF